MTAKSKYTCINNHTFDDPAIIGEQDSEYLACPCCKVDYFMYTKDHDKLLVTTRRMDSLVQFFHHNAINPFFGITKNGGKHFVCYRRKADKTLLLDVYHTNFMYRHYQGQPTVDHFPTHNPMQALVDFEEKCKDIRLEYIYRMRLKTRIKGSGRQQKIKHTNFEQL